MAHQLVIVCKNHKGRLQNPGDQADTSSGNQGVKQWMYTQ